MPEKAKLVKRLYELYATGNYTLKTLPQQLYKEGYRYLPSTHKIPSKTAEKLLGESFTGVFLPSVGKNIAASMNFSFHRPCSARSSGF